MAKSADIARYTRKGYIQPANLHYADSRRPINGTAFQYCRHEKQSLAETNPPHHLLDQQPSSNGAAANDQEWSIDRFGNVTFDQARNIYGTTSAGGNGASDCGIVWELTPSGGGWTENILFTFISGSDGCSPYSGVIFDSAGSIYGNTFLGGDGTGNGTVYQLTQLNRNWVENILADGSQGTGSYPMGTLIMDQSGSLYSTASDYFSGQGGTVFKVSRSGSGWIASLEYAFGSCQPDAGATLGPDGNLYGVCALGGTNNYGWIFEMPPSCNGTCTPTDPHDFDNSDGANPVGPVVFDANGNLYGTTLNGGNVGTNCQYGCGVVWEIAGVGARH